MTVNVSIFYQSSGVIPSTIYYSNTRHPFCMNKALLALRAISYFRENSKFNRKGVYLSIKYDRKYVNIESKFIFNPIKSLLQLYKISVMHELSLNFVKIYFTFEEKFQTL